MNQQQVEKMRHGKGFIAALDQSGGSTPKALAAYGISESAWSNEEEMFDLVHAMRTRIITSPAFTSEKILGAILFEQTMDRSVEGKLTADYLWDVKGILPFLKVDKGLDVLADGVQLMKPITGLDDLLKRAVERHIFGTKMRSVIKEANAEGIARVVAQQFDYGRQIAAAGLVPIIEPEVDITAPDKACCEEILKAEMLAQLDKLPHDVMVMLKLSIPTVDGFYSDVMNHSCILRVVALSGGYSQKEANERLARNPGLIASFSRALSEGLTAQQSDQEFNQHLAKAVEAIYEASIS